MEAFARFVRIFAKIALVFLLLLILQSGLGALAAAAQPFSGVLGGVLRGSVIVLSLANFLLLLFAAPQFLLLGRLGVERLTAYFTVGVLSAWFLLIVQIYSRDLTNLWIDSTPIDILIRYLHGLAAVPDTVFVLYNVWLRSLFWMGFIGMWIGWLWWMFNRRASTGQRDERGSPIGVTVSWWTR